VTRVDFYILERPAADGCLNLACRLAEKAVRQDNAVLINTASRADSARLDDLLWTFSQSSFLPHRVIGDNDDNDEGEPVLIGCDQVPEEGRWDLLINLAPAVPEFFGRFARMAELVGADEENKSAARERFRYYRDRGYELHTHHV
jgi:DNA polymerase-3 subunit chi